MVLSVECLKWGGLRGSVLHSIHYTGKVSTPLVLNLSSPLVGSDESIVPYLDTRLRSRQVEISDRLSRLQQKGPESSSQL